MEYLRYIVQSLTYTPKQQLYKTMRFNEATCHPFG